MGGNNVCDSNRAMSQISLVLSSFGRFQETRKFEIRHEGDSFTLTLPGEREEFCEFLHLLHHVDLLGLVLREVVEFLELCAQRLTFLLQRFLLCLLLFLYDRRLLFK